MKRILTLGLVALGLTLGTNQEASAWVNFKFGAGINWQWQSGNNNILWGAFRDGQVPGPEFFTGYGGCPGGNCGGFMPDQFQYYGGLPAGAQHAQAPQTPAAAPNSAPTPGPTTQAPMPGYNPYISVSHRQNAYPQPVYYQPYYYQGVPTFYQAPNYYQYGVNFGR